MVWRKDKSIKGWLEWFKTYACCLQIFQLFEFVSSPITCPCPFINSGLTVYWEKGSIDVYKSVAWCTNKSFQIYISFALGLLRGLAILSPQAYVTEFIHCGGYVRFFETSARHLPYCWMSPASCVNAFNWMGEEASIKMTSIWVKVA